MPIWRVREIADHFDFTSLEDANDFVNGKPKDVTLKDYARFEPNRYVVSPVTEQELQDEIETMVNELKTHAKNVKDLPDNEYAFKDEYDELQTRLNTYRDALYEMSQSTAVSDVSMIRATESLLHAALYLSPTGGEQQSFNAMVEEMKEEREPQKKIAIELLSAMLNGLRYNNWL